MLAIAVALGTLAATPLSAQRIPTAVIADPTPDPEHPAKLIQLRYPGAGSRSPRGCSSRRATSRTRPC